MLKNKLLRRIFLILSCLFIIFILSIFPKKDEKDSRYEIENNHTEKSIYLIDSSNYVSRVSVTIKSDDIINEAKEIVNYLTIGSKNSTYIKAGFSPIIPKNTKLLSVDLDDDLLKLNFTREFFKISAEDEEKMISALIYSLTTIEGVNKISIYIEDSILNELPHAKKPLPPTLDRGFGINKVYDLTKVRGAINTTVYYLSKYEDYYYYVPVTMVSNEDKDKLEIIINELTSKTMYQTNLISYLNDTKEINYEVDDEYILITLGNSLYKDLNDSHLIETVIYSINLSIKENYEVKTVMYMVDGIIINSYFI